MPVSRTRGVRRLLCLALAAAAAAVPAEAATMRAFVTSATCNGNLGACTAAVGDVGVAAANNLCQELAATAGLTGGGEIFRAWISDATADAYCNVLGLAGQRFGAPACGVGSLPAAGPWVRRDGLPFAASIADLVGAGPITPLGRTEGGLTVPTSYFHTGSNSDGTHRASHSCGGWIDGTASGLTAGGNTDVVHLIWASGASTTCETPRRLICLEVGAGDPFAYPSQPGALAFVSSASGPGKMSLWAGSGGTDGLFGADAVCRSLATAALLPFPTSFVAFLSAAPTSALSRLTIDGPWERVDGVPIAASAADLTDGALAAPISLDETGAQPSEDVWTGSDEGGLPAGSDCAGWTSALGADTGMLGRSWRSESSWTGGSSSACDQSLYRLFCFSNQILLGWDHFESGDFRRWSEAVGLP
jgi:hypothetical protein